MRIYLTLSLLMLQQINHCYNFIAFNNTTAKIKGKQEIYTYTHLYNKILHYETHFLSLS